MKLVVGLAEIVLSFLPGSADVIDFAWRAALRGKLVGIGKRVRAVALDP